jgi:hypothetical protein
MFDPFLQSAQHFYEKREGSGSGSVVVTNIRIRETLKHSYPTDPELDPEHRYS